MRNNIPVTVLFVALVAAAGAARLAECTRMMAVTGDLVRHLCYGVLVNEAGWAVAGRPLDAFPSLAGVTWSWVPYNYPVVTLAFFSGVAAVWPAIFAAKLALTAVEAVNAVLVARISGSRWMGALYWAAPVSVWWVSREGQFEPLQNLFVLGALWGMGIGRTRSLQPPASSLQPFLAFALLALGIQVKLSAVFLLPFFAVRAAGRRMPFFPCALGFLAGLAPTMLALCAYPVLNAVSDNLASLHYNPYRWNPLDPSWRGWVPVWLAGFNAAVTWAALGILAWGLAKPGPWLEKAAFVAPLLFLIAIKSHANVQFWYMILWPSFVMPIENRKIRWALMGLYPFLDITSALAMAGWVLGPVNPASYQALSVFAGIVKN